MRPSARPRFVVTACCPSLIAAALPLFLASAALGESPAPPSTPAVLDALFAGERVTTPLDAVIAQVELPADQDFRIVELSRDAGTSHHVVAIRDREQPHRHDRHDLFVVILRGHGTMLLGREERPVGVGSILYVPRGTPHAFRNASGEPAVAYAVYAPAFDGTDRVVTDLGTDPR